MWAPFSWDHARYSGKANAVDRGPKDHINIRILPTMILVSPLYIGP